MKRSLTILVALFSIIIGLAKPGQARAQTHVLVDMTMQLPSTPPYLFDSFYEGAMPVIKDGKIVFLALDATHRSGLYMSDGRSLTKIINADDIDPPTGTTYGITDQHRPCVGKVAFTSHRPASLTRVFFWDGLTVTNVANGTTQVPGGLPGETFVSFGDVDTDGSRVVFVGSGTNFAYGLYLWNGATVAEAVSPSYVPNEFALVGNLLTFTGETNGNLAILRKDLTSGAITVLVDTTTLAPGGSPFTSFDRLAVSSNHLAFEG